MSSTGSLNYSVCWMMKTFNFLSKIYTSQTLKNGAIKSKSSIVFPDNKKIWFSFWMYIFDGESWGNQN